MCDINYVLASRGRGLEECDTGKGPTKNTTVHRRNDRRCSTRFIFSWGCYCDSTRTRCKTQMKASHTLTITHPTMFALRRMFELVGGRKYSMGVSCVVSKHYHDLIYKHVSQTETQMHCYLGKSGAVYNNGDSEGPNPKINTQFVSSSWQHATALP